MPLWELTKDEYDSHGIKAGQGRAGVHEHLASYHVKGKLTVSRAIVNDIRT